MKWLGLTGGIASGKSLVSSIIKEIGYPVVDADQMARLAVAPKSRGLEMVRSAFGPGVILSDGSLDRKALGQIAFSDPDKRAQLEGILHPIIQQFTQAERHRLEQEGWPAAFYDVPLLFEKKLEGQFDGTALVYCAADEQKKRLMKRDALSEPEAKQRIAAQMPLEQKKPRATYVIENVGTVEDLRCQVEGMLTFFKLSLSPSPGVAKK